MTMKSVELFAGAGGLAMGVSLAGFESCAVVEWDKWACDTVRENQSRGYPLVANWPVSHSDVRAFDWQALPQGIDLLAGGPPCQPFSMAGKHRAFGDQRDMFPATVEVVRQLQPKAFIIENVKGLTRASFADYFRYIQLMLSYPELKCRADESWLEHLNHLDKRALSGHNNSELSYNVIPTLINAADYGIAQKRERVFIVGFRSDLNTNWYFPNPTHSLDALLYQQYVTGEYWQRHNIDQSQRPEPAKNCLARIKRLQKLPSAPKEQPWKTVRDALKGLPEPKTHGCFDVYNHKLQPGARVYKGHTGSPLDLPAKTLKAGDHGVPGGENMMVKLNGEVRYFTVRESARLQSFPDGYVFHGSWTETMRQLGNAVPVSLARQIASSVAVALIKAQAPSDIQTQGRNVA